MGWTEREKIKIARNNHQRIFGVGVASRNTKVECARCDEVLTLRQMEVHHIKAKSKGGKDNLQNYALLCPKCNKEVGAKEEMKRKRRQSITDDIFGR